LSSDILTVAFAEARFIATIRKTAAAARSFMGKFSAFFLCNNRATIFVFFLGDQRRALLYR